jgi:hypothetical protein
MPRGAGKWTCGRAPTGTGSRDGAWEWPEPRRDLARGAWGRTAVCDGVRAIVRGRLLERLGTVPEPVFAQIMRALTAIEWCGPARNLCPKLLVDRFRELR